MTDALTILPLLFVAAGAAAAAAMGLPALNRRLSTTAMGWLLAAAPAAAFVALLALAAALAGAPASGAPALTPSIPWMPSLGLRASLYVDHLSVLFGLIVTGIGALVVVYAGYYFKGDRSAWRFFAYLLLFMASMLGVVMAGDIVTLFVFWEGTSVVSYLLVAYKTKDEAARRGAFKALFITGGGGIALLAGLVFVASVAGGSDLPTILSSGDALRSSAWYLPMLALVALGAFTKSAQFPAHIWLPDAMSAPTPASAYLHSATMVKAGIFLMARLYPALGGTEAWFWLLSTFGLITMLTGAYLGLKQNDLKALLAYSTISQLGALMMMIGQETSEAFKALVVGVLAHALYKGALFLVAGIVDHESGTRDLRRLGGLARKMRTTFVVGTVAALSMAGFPPLLGFLGKETLLAAALHPDLPVVSSALFPIIIVVSAALLVAQSGMLIYDTFLGRPRDAEVVAHAHEVPAGMLIGPGVLAALSVFFAVTPALGLDQFLAAAAAAAYGGKVKVSLAIFTGFNTIVLLSAIAIGLGILLFFLRHRARAAQMRVNDNLAPFNGLYRGTLRLLDGLAAQMLRLQSGRLRRYLAIMLIGMAAVLAFFGALRLPAALPDVLPGSESAALRVFALALSVAAAAASIAMRRDLYAVIALSASGLSVAVMMVLEPAPDVALVQVLVDLLTMVILVLAVSRLPFAQRQRASEFTFRQSRPGLLRDALLSAGAGAVVALISLTALAGRPRDSVVTPYYEQNAKPLTGASDIVGAIVVDFRGFDTLIEISVFAMAGLGVYTLLRYAARKHGDDEARDASGAGEPGSAQSGSLHPVSLTTLGIGSPRTSAFVHLLAYLSFPISVIIAITYMMYGHDQPGDGFTAGVILSLSIGFWYVVFGYHETKRRLPWIRPAPLIASGILLAMASAVAAAALTGSFFAPVDFGELIGLPLPRGFHLSTSFVFEVSICLAVLGSAGFILDTMGHPGREDADAESAARAAEIQARAGEKSE